MTSVLAERVWSALVSWPVSAVRVHAGILIRRSLGLPDSKHTPDRETLEQVILPAYARRGDIRTVLFVGCDWYTRHYEQMFSGANYWTLDPDPWKRRFGARRHLVAGLEDIDTHFAPGSVDLIVCNGVYGWGLNSRVDCERAFEGCFGSLRESGHFILGWNDRPTRRPVPLESLASLARFRPERFDGLGSSYLANPAKRHVFNFYTKPALSALRRRGR